MHMRTHSRRRVVIGLAAATLLPPRLRAEDGPTIEVHKDPNCGCCVGWMAHLSRNGFVPHAIDSADMASIKQRLGVPEALSSCHTAMLGGYVIEGHVPAVAIKRLLAERPAVIGLAAPGMPAGSPGMEGGTPVTYEVIAWTATSQSLFGRYRGSTPV